MGELDSETVARLLQTAFGLFSEPAAERPTLAAIGEAAGVSSRSLRYWYGDVETLYRLAVIDRIAALAASFAAQPPTLPLREAIRSYAIVCAGLFASDDYRRLIYLVMRDGPASPWLVARHERWIVEAAREGLARLVRHAGMPSGSRLEIRASGTRAFVERLQGELAVLPLLPSHKALTRQQVRALVERSTEEALASVYSGRAVALALGEMLPSTRRLAGATSAAAASPQ